MDAVRQAAQDIGLVLQNEWRTQKKIEAFASKADNIVEVSNYISDMYYLRIHACLDVLNEEVVQQALNCSINHSDRLADGAMLIRQMCLYLGSSVFDDIAQDYIDMLPESPCLGCEKPVPNELAYCIECQIAMADDGAAVEMA
jgi:hypothetical protein